MNDILQNLRRIFVTTRTDLEAYLTPLTLKGGFDAKNLAAALLEVPEATLVLMKHAGLTLDQSREVCRILDGTAESVEALNRLEDK